VCQFNEKMKLCVFPNDPIQAYYSKGEIKDRYFNPKNLFDEIHIISFSKDDVEVKKVQKIAGKAKLQIHCVGKINLKNRMKNVHRIIRLLKSINPDVIRAYNPLVEGWFAATCSDKLEIPMFLSIHLQYDHTRKLAKKSNLKKYLALKLTEKFLEPYVIKKATKITMVYRIIEPYIIRMGGVDFELLYNKIDYNQFVNSTSLDFLQKPLVISVGNLIKEKNHECVIKSMKNLDAHLLIIGKGKHKKQLLELIKKENLGKKITMIESVPHDKIQDYYKSAHVFAYAYDPELEGLPMPVIEAMASGLPVVIPYPKKEYSDGLETIAIFSNRNSTEFSEKIKKLLNDKNFWKKHSQKSQNKAKEFDMNKIEKREAEIYLELIQKKTKTHEI